MADDFSGLRERYRQLIEKVEKPGAVISEDVISESNDLLSQVRRTQELVIDIKFYGIAVRKLTAVCRLANNSSIFSTDDFADKLVGQLRSDGDNIAPRDWVDFGINVQSHFRKPPYLRFMLGAVEKDQSDAAVPDKKPRRSAARDRGTGPVSATRISVADTKPVGMSVGERVDAVLRDMTAHFRSGGKKSPLNYFEFVVDPTSFSDTVKNMFDVSFLVKERRASMYFDEAGVPFVSPAKTCVRNADAGESAGESDDERPGQVIMSITKAQWRQLAAILDRKKPMITGTKDM